MWLIGWTCDWAGPDNFLHTAFFDYRGKPVQPEFAYKNDELNQAMVDALAATDEATARPTGRRRRTSSAPTSHHSDRLGKPPAAGADHVRASSVAVR